MFYSQEDDGVVALDLPIRNSLTYNQYIINPTFSFVRQQYKYLSITNKRQWVSFDNAPLTYLASYSGRFRENIGIGVGLFQQDYGVLTTFGGIVNFAYNVQLQRESNLTFGMNVGAYSSGVNTGKVITNYPDPSLNNIPSNFLLSVSPGINYGLAFFDFGISANNLFLYNFTSSELIQDNPEKGYLVSVMYTGYMYSRGFLDESKFSAIIKSDFRQDQTIISGTAMLTIPKGIWAQVGYNSLYGIHGGLGLNITKQISIEYNYEKATGDLSSFGSSHELTLAYKFNNKERYDYSREDEVSALISPEKKKNVAKPTNQKAEANRKASQAAKAAAAEQAIIAEETNAQKEAQKQERITAEAQALVEAQEQERLAAEAQALAEAQEQQRLAAEAQVLVEAQKQERLAAEAQALAEAQEQERLAAEALALAEAQEQERLAAEAQALAEAQEQERLAAEAQALAEAQEQERLATEAAAQTQAEEQARLATEAIAQAEAETNTLPDATDNLGITMNEIVESTDDSRKTQEELLTKLEDAVASREKDLKDLKEENDLSEQGIYMEPKPFKSITAENQALEALKADLDAVIKARSQEIKELELLYGQKQESDTIVLNEVNLFYQKKINKLKAEQQAAIQAKAELEAQLEDIKVATDFERKRRIKRAAFKNQEDRYEQDIATLNLIKENTALSSTPYTEDDFDYGEDRGNNIKIVKNVKNEDNGYYVILAVHSDVEKRDEFLTKVVASGQKNINFFYDVNTSKYYIYLEKFDSIDSANRAIESKEDKPYNSKLSIVKIEN
jgi:type IX secretion system PorP/SprF family membrane protein